MSVCYNIGIGGLQGSTFLKRVNAGDLVGAHDHILDRKRPAVIIERREAKAEQFVTAYIDALLRPTSDQSRINVAAPVAAGLDPKIPTPVIVPVNPQPIGAPASRKSWGNRLFSVFSLP